MESSAGERQVQENGSGLLLLVFGVAGVVGVGVAEIDEAGRAQSGDLAKRQADIVLVVGIERADTAGLGRSILLLLLCFRLFSPAQLFTGPWPSKGGRRLPRHIHRGAP